MLKKLNAENKKSISESLSNFKKLPKSKKVYFQSKRFRHVNVGMREISLEDQDIKNLIVYDTSGFYSDQNYKHNYEKGLKPIRSRWLADRKGIKETAKIELKFLDHSKCKVRTFPSIPKKILNTFQTTCTDLPKTPPTPPQNSPETIKTSEFLRGVLDIPRWPHT